MELFKVGDKVKIIGGGFKGYEVGIGKVVRATPRKVTVRVDSVGEKITTARVGQELGFRQNKWNDTLIGEEWGHGLRQADPARKITWAKVLTSGGERTAY